MSESKETMQTEKHAEEENVSRIVDFRIPLPWLLTGTAGICWGLISMWFSVNQLVKTVDDLQITVKSGNTSVVAVAGELALLKFRIANVEDAVKRVTDAPTVPRNQK